MEQLVYGPRHEEKGGSEGGDVTGGRALVSARSESGSGERKRARQTFRAPTPTKHVPLNTRTI